MKIRKGFVSNSSSSSYICVPLNDRMLHASFGENSIIYLYDLLPNYSSIMNCNREKGEESSEYCTYRIISGQDVFDKHESMLEWLKEKLQDITDMRDGKGKSVHYISDYDTVERAQSQVDKEIEFISYLKEFFKPDDPFLYIYCTGDSCGPIDYSWTEMLMNTYFDVERVFKHFKYFWGRL